MQRVVADISAMADMRAMVDVSVVVDGVALDMTQCGVLPCAVEIESEKKEIVC